MSRLVVFDCDGTLVDSQVAIVGAMCEASRRAGLAVPAAERIRRVVGLNLHEAVHRLFPELEEDGIETVSNHYKDEFLLLRQNRDFDEPLYPGTRECLTALAESGVTLLRSLRRDLRQAEVRPPSALERRRRRQDGWAWVDELCQASVAPYEPIIAVRRVLRLWVGVAQQAAITGSAAAFAA